MKIPHTKLRRLYCVAASFLLAIFAILPALNQSVGAVGQVSSRSVEMSSSALGATATYLTSFTTATTGNIQGVVIDFCANSPIIGDSGGCTTTGTLAGFTIGASPAASNTGLSGTWVTTSSTAHTLIYSNATGGSVTSGTPLTITITGVTNPTTTAGSFYARIMTFATSAAATAYTSATPGSYVDYGGAAMSTANVIPITARVMETMTFCVSGVTMSSACGSMTTPNLTLGHGTPPVLTATATDTAQAFTQISTNASSGAIVRMKASNSCSNGGLSSTGGTVCQIPGISGGPSGITSGVAAFGMCVTPGSANTAALSPYNNSGCTQYGMDGTNVVSTYGSSIFNTASLPVNTENDTLTFAATASNTTAAGAYTTTETLIATGTF